MKTTLAGLGAGLVLLAPAPLPAHHSFAAEYDQNKTVMIKGVVTKVEWMNPHVYFYVDVKDQSGKVVNWAVELGNVSTIDGGAAGGRTL